MYLVHCLEKWRSNLTWPYLSMPFRSSTTLLTHTTSVTIFKFTSEQHKNLILINLQHFKRHIITECSSTFHQKQLLASFKTIQQGKQMEICLLISTHLVANLPHFSDFHLKIVDLLSRYITLICPSYYNFESISMTFIYSSERLLFKVVLI